jgi:hypothetical protein
MALTGCEEFLYWFCKRQATDSEFRVRLAEAMRSSVDPLASAIRVIADADAEYAPTARKEFEELPQFAVSTLLHAWLEATTRNLPFAAHSVRPDRPVEFARERRVRVSVDESDRGIDVRLSHIPTRHPVRV